MAMLAMFGMDDSDRRVHGHPARWGGDGATKPRLRTSGAVGSGGVAGGSGRGKEGQRGRGRQMRLGGREAAVCWPGPQALLGGGVGCQGKWRNGGGREKQKRRERMRGKK